MARILMYKTPVCPYCVRAKTLLKQKGQEKNIVEIDITTNAALREEMLTKTGGKRTVPQIFIGDTYVGGCDDLYALNSAGKLDDLLK